MSVPESRLRRWRRRLKRLAIRCTFALAFLLILREVVVTVLWSRHSKEEDRALERLLARDGRRTPLTGPAVPGNAWDDYAAAASAGALDPMDDSALRAAWQPFEKPGDRDRAVACLEKWGPYLEQIEAGTRRECFRMPAEAMEFNEWGGVSIPRVPRAAVVLLAARARRQISTGNLDGAIRDLGVALQVTLDVAHGLDMFSVTAGMTCLYYTLDAGRELVVSPLLSKEQAVRLEALLASADAQYPLMSECRDSCAWGESACSRARMKWAELPRGPFRRFIWVPERPWLPAALPPWWTLWREAFSYRLAAIKDQKLLAELDARIPDVESLSWEEACRIREDCRVRFEEHSTSLARDWRPALILFELSCRDNRAHLRLLQAGLQIRLGREPGGPGWPIDPFSLGPMRIREMDGLHVIWSEGPDGDQGGVGGWSIRQEPEDIILVVGNGS